MDSDIEMSKEEIKAELADFLARIVTNEQFNAELAAYLNN